MENIIVASSNLIGLMAYPYCSEVEGRALLMAILSSTIYHLIEHQKHGMVGVSDIPYLYPLSGPLFHQIFLNLDRICAIYCSYTFFRWRILKEMNTILVELIVGLICMYFAENIFTLQEQKLLYIISHTIWHVLAYVVIISIKLTDE